MKIKLMPFILIVFAACSNNVQTVKMSDELLRDKIAGGWAGQTIGVVYGAPVEFRYCGSLIPDYEPIPWGQGYVKYWWDKKPGLFDDIYNDLTIAQAFEELGLDCPIDSLAHRFAYADYHLAHANQAARYNIRQGIIPPESGHWLNNPHADDLDFQIESDFIGLMSPGMVNQALDIASKVGHIMNSGDGFYGGAFVSALYAAAFIESNPAKIIDIALSTIPRESSFRQCIEDVKKFHKKFPSDWKRTWFEIQKKWDCDYGCPKGTFLSFNIDAKLNAAYIAIGLLYGKGDFSKSMEITTRCGQDADCNPSTVGGVLGVALGISGIPEFWVEPLREIWSLNFEGTELSLEKGAQFSYNAAKKQIKAIGGVDGNILEIPQQKIKVLPIEQNFTDSHPIFRDKKDCWMKDTYSFDFDGNGFVVYGGLVCIRNITPDYASRVAKKHLGSEVFSQAELYDPYIAEVEVWIDGELDHVSIMPMKAQNRKLEPAWKYMLNEGRHNVKLVWKNPDPKQYLIRINDIVYYSSKRNTDNYYYNK